MLYNNKSSFTLEDFIFFFFSHKSYCDSSLTGCADEENVGLGLLVVPVFPLVAETRLRLAAETCWNIHQSDERKLWEPSGTSDLCPSSCSRLGPMWRKGLADAARWWVSGSRSLTSSLCAEEDFMLFWFHLLINKLDWLNIFFSPILHQINNSRLELETPLLFN